MVETNSTIVASRVLQIFFFSFAYIFCIAKIIGSENKLKWFKRRTKTTFFNRKGFLGEYINFGYPITWQGMLVFFAIYGVIFSVGYIYIFMY